MVSFFRVALSNLPKELAARRREWKPPAPKLVSKFWALQVLDEGLVFFFTALHILLLLLLLEAWILWHTWQIRITGMSGRITVLTQSLCCLDRWGPRTWELQPHELTRFEVGRSLEERSSNEAVEKRIRWWSQRAGSSLILHISAYWPLQRPLQTEVHRVQTNDPSLESLDFGCFHVPRGRTRWPLQIQMESNGSNQLYRVRQSHLDSCTILLDHLDHSAVWEFFFFENNAFCRRQGA